MEFSWKKIWRKISQHGHKENMRTAYGFIGKLGASLYLIRRIYGELNLYTECQGLRLFLYGKCA